ncbi:hypothetical protein B0T10DRAFT_552895 [Thelonectria olida]|uniref:DUF6570 domain-containing protein n=1 Tax=Thelonectria olida TaxID=1576542 RepID=A0A9P9AL99_9HYPO|nr:hypothetical protein B0T10DRAFT_552895 [Thelonectria olida]
MMEHDADRETGFLTPAEPHGAKVRSSDDDADQRHRIGSGGAAEDDERQQEPHTAVAIPAPTFRPILPKEARRIGEDEGGAAAAGLSNRREEWSNGHKRQVMPGLVRRTRIRRGRSTVRTDGGRDGGRDGGVDVNRALLRPVQPKGSTGISETGERLYPSPGPTQQTQEGEAPTEHRGGGTQKGHEPADEGGIHPKRRPGRPRTRNQASIAGGVALRAIRPREVQHEQEEAHTEETLRPGGGRGGFGPGRAGLRRGPADTPPAPFGSRRRGSRRAESARRPARPGGAQEQQAWRHIAPATSPMVREILAESVPVPELETTSTSNASRRRRRTNQIAREGPPVKRIRSDARKERTEEERREDLTSVLRSLDEEFAEKERLSHNREWCTPVPHERKVSTVQAFYKAFHNTETLPVWTCMVCYRKCGKGELEGVKWDQWLSRSMDNSGDPSSPFSCRKCFPVGRDVLACPECARCLMRGYLSAAARLHVRLGCEHMFPEELKGLTPVEEKLISLNSCYGFITKYSVVDGQRQGVTYPKHVKGHITVFPNNVQELVTKVLPHPLVKVMDEIHVSWHGARKPGPSDLSRLLSVRRRVVERALRWLQRNNPHYRDVEIDEAEMDSWGAPTHDVPSQILQRMERNEPSAWEKVRTAQIVPPAERGIDDEDAVDIDEVIAMLRCEQQGEAECHHQEASRGNEALSSGGGSDGANGDRQGAQLESPEAAIHEVSSSGMFALDALPDVTDADRLQFAWEAVGEDGEQEAGQILGQQRTTGGWAGSASVRQGLGMEPYISVSRGEDFADSSDPLFFAKTFPSLLPFGTGEQAGQRISYFEAYPYRGEILRDLCLYDYMSLVTLKRRANAGASAAAWGEIPFRDGAPFSDKWIQGLRPPGKHAVVCLDGYLSMDFSQDDDAGPCHRRAAVQHLGLFVPWECFLSESSGDIDDIWARQKAVLSRRLLFILDNIQLLRRSAEDAKRDAKQWAASSGDDERTIGVMEPGDGGGGSERRRSKSDHGRLE